MRKYSALLLLVTASHLFAGGGYAYSGTLTIPAASGSVTLTDFTSPFSFSDAKFATAANGGAIQNTSTRNGYTSPDDLVFTNDATCATVTGSYTWGFDGDYSPTAGTGHGWFGMPSLTISSNVVPTVCVGNAAVNTYQGGAVGDEYDANTVAFWHEPNGSTLNLSDASSNGLTLTNNSSTAATGLIDGGAEFVAASTQYQSRANGAIFCPNDFTWSAWVKANSFPNAYNSVIGNETGGVGSSNITVLVKSNGKLAVYASAQNSPSWNANYDGTGLNTLSTGTWYRLSATWSTATKTLTGYVNGVLDGSGTVVGGAPTFGSCTAFSGSLYIGSSITTPRYWDGYLDEVRFDSTARSIGWLATEYAEQNSVPAIGALTAFSGSGSGFQVGGFLVGP